MGLVNAEIILKNPRKPISELMQFWNFQHRATLFSLKSLQFTFALFRDTMSDWIFWKVSYGIGMMLVGGLLFAPRTKRWSAPQWVKNCITIADLFAIILSFKNLAEAGWSSAFSVTTTKYLNTYGTFFGGLFTGIILTLFISGELKLRKPNNKKRPRQTAKEIHKNK